MNTKVVKIDREHPDPAVFEEAARILRGGGLVAFPTETVYGLGANALDEEAARRIYAAKGRPSDNPLIAHIADEEGLAPLTAEIPDMARRLMKAFWPGPLTMIFKKSPAVPYSTTGGLDTVAVRMPSDEAARRLIRTAGIPIAAPSANTSGRPSPTTAEHVAQDMTGRIEMILDGGPVGIGVESTIVDVSGPQPVLLRPGAVTMEMLEATAGPVAVDPAITGPMRADVKPKAPGMKYRHYAPSAELILVEEAAHTESREAVSEAVIAAINRLADEQSRLGKRVGILCTDETRNRYAQGDGSRMVRSLGRRSSADSIARNLFAALREFDDLGADIIYSESFSKDHLGQAIMNRLTKAAGYHIVSPEEIGKDGQ